MLASKRTLFAVLLTGVAFLAFDPVLAESFDELLDRADAGQADAQYEVGCAYERGKKVRPDRKTAQEWLEKAAGQHHQESIRKLAKEYYLPRLDTSKFSFLLENLATFYEEQENGMDVDLMRKVPVYIQSLLNAGREDDAWKFRNAFIESSLAHNGKLAGLSRSRKPDWAVWDEKLGMLVPWQLSKMRASLDAKLPAVPYATQAKAAASEVKPDVAKATVGKKPRKVEEDVEENKPAVEEKNKVVAKETKTMVAEKPVAEKQPAEESKPVVEKKAEKVVEEVKPAVEEKVEEVVEEVKPAVEEKVEKVVEEAKPVVEKKAEEVVEEAKPIVEKKTEKVIEEIAPAVEEKVEKVVKEAEKVVEEAKPIVEKKTEEVIEEIIPAVKEKVEKVVKETEPTVKETEPVIEKKTVEVIEETKPVPVSEEKPEPVVEEKPEAPAAEKPRSKWSFGFLKKNAKQETAPVEEKAEEVVEEKPAEEASPEPVVEEKPEPVAEEKTEAQAAEKPRSKWNLGSHSFHKVFGRGNKNAE